MSKTTSKKKNGKEQQDEHRTSIAELTTVAIAGLIVLFLIGFSLYSAVTARDGTPHLVVTAKFDEMRKNNSFFVLPVEVRNLTGPTAEDVIVGIQLNDPGGQPEDKRVEVAYLPEAARIEAFVALKHRPSAENVEFDIESYKTP